MDSVQDRFRSENMALNIPNLGLKSYIFFQKRTLYYFKNQKHNHTPFIKVQS